MIKKILSILMAVIMAFSVAQIAFAADGAVYDKKTGSYTEKQFVYYIDDYWEEMWIDDYIGTGDTIYIPKTLGGYELTPDHLYGSIFRKSNASAFSVDADNKYFSVKDGVLFSKDGTVLIAYPNGKAGDSYDIPEGVEELDYECFYFSSLKEVTFPSTLAYVDWNVFGDSFADFLEQTTDGLIYVGNNLVGSAEEYTSEFVFVRDGTEKIFNYSLPSNTVFVVVPDSVKEIGEKQEGFGYICGNEGSYAQKFAEENEYHFITLGEGHTHSYFYGEYSSKAPTCVSKGEAVFVCPCGERCCKTVEKKADAHYFVAYKNGERHCLYCGVSFSEYYYHCSCRCHITGGFHIDTSSFISFFADLFFRIKLVFWHLTGIHQYCECGCRHY